MLLLEAKSYLCPYNKYPSIHTFFAGIPVLIQGEKRRVNVFFATLKAHELLKKENKEKPNI